MGGGFCDSWIHRHFRIRSDRWRLRSFAKVGDWRGVWRFGVPSCTYICTCLRKYVQWRVGGCWWAAGWWLVVAPWRHHQPSPSHHHQPPLPYHRPIAAQHQLISTVTFVCHTTQQKNKCSQHRNEDPIL